MFLTVNGMPLDEREVAEEIARLRPKHDDAFRSVPGKEREEQLRAWARENVIERMLLRQAAEEYGKSLSRELLEESFKSLITKEGGYVHCSQKLSARGSSMEKFRRDFDQQFCMEMLIDSVAGNIPPPGEEEVRRRYAADPSRFTTPDIVRAGQIVFHVGSTRTRDEALRGIREIQAMLSEGRDFEELAGRFSDCPENEGDLGWFAEGEMVEGFESAVFAMAPGEVSSIIETEFGFHLAKLYEKRAGSNRSFEEVRETLLAERVQEIKGELLEKFVDSLRSAATIVQVP